MINEEKEFMDTCDLYLLDAGVKEQWQRIRQCGKLWVLVERLEKKSHTRQPHDVKKYYED